MSTVATKPNANVRRLAVGAGIVLCVTVAMLVGIYAVVRLSHERLSPQRLPGLQIDLPEGESLTRDKHRYGQITVQTGGKNRSHVLVRWDTGTLLEDNDRDLVLSVFTGDHGSPKYVHKGVAIPVPDGLSANSWATREGSDIQWGTQIVCGQRRFLVLTRGSHWHLEALHRRIVASVRCHPDGG